jgi:quinol monooxygenase YgiN
LSTNFSNVQQEKGNVVFALHRLAENLNEFWIWESQEDRARGSRINKSKLRPLVEGDVVLIGNAAPIAVKG